MTGSLFFLFNFMPRAMPPLPLEIPTYPHRPRLISSLPFRFSSNHPL